MITGEIKNQIDRIWDVFWTSGMTNPMNILEQMTYLFFMKMLDDKQIQEEPLGVTACRTLCLVRARGTTMITVRM